MKLTTATCGSGYCQARGSADWQRRRAALQLAAAPCVGEGLTFDLCYCQSSEDGFDPDRHFAFLRSDGKSTWLVVANFGPSAPISIHIPTEAIAYLGMKPEQTDFTLSVPERDFHLVEL